MMTAKVNNNSEYPCIVNEVSKSEINDDILLKIGKDSTVYACTMCVDNEVYVWYDTNSEPEEVYDPGYCENCTCDSCTKKRQEESKEEEGSKGSEKEDTDDKEDEEDELCYSDKCVAARAAEIDQ